VSSLILASSSRYRAELLARLKVDFSQQSPDCDETPLRDETPAQLVQRLAALKASTIARQQPNCIVIGSDQVADLHGAVMGKPDCHQQAVEQLRSVSGREVVFRTGVCLLHRAQDQEDLFRIDTVVRFHELTDERIERYLQADQPYDCACSFRSESLGSSLVSEMRSSDPSALIGLPLIRLSEGLNRLGLNIP